MDRQKEAEVTQAFLEECFEDPVFYIENVLGIRLWQKQKEIARAVAASRRTAVKACHASGKSLLASALVLWHYSMRRPSLTFTTATTNAQVEDVIWKDIGTLHDNAVMQHMIPGRLYDVKPRMTSARDHFAMGFATDEGEAFQGKHAQYLLAIYDEAVGVLPAIWEAGDGNLASGDTHLLTLGNPTNPDCQFYRECQAPSTVVFSISAFDTPYFTELGITEEDMLREPDDPEYWEGKWRPEKCSFYPIPLCTPQYVAGVIERYGYQSPTYMARVLGEFPDSATDALIPTRKIYDAKQRWNDWKAGKEVTLKPEGDYQVGTDVAEQGGDRTVRCVAQGLSVEHIHRNEVPEGVDPDEYFLAQAFGNKRIVHGAFIHELMSSQFEETTETAKRVVMTIDEINPVKVTIDGIGPGSNVCSYLRSKGYQFSKFMAGSKATNWREYRDQKAEMYAWLRRLFVEDMIAIPPDDELIEELMALRYDFTQQSGQMFIIDKKYMRKVLKRSPDKAEALMLAVAPLNNYYIADGLDKNDANRGQGQTSSAADGTDIEAERLAAFSNFTRQIGIRT